MSYFLAARPSPTFTSVLFSPPLQPDRDKQHTTRVARRPCVMAFGSKVEKTPEVCDFGSPFKLTPLLLLDREQLDFEDKRGVGRNDVATALLTVCQVRRNGELAFAADLHTGNAFVPALDYHPGAEPKLERP